MDEVVDECDEFFEEREKKTFNVTGERKYARSKSAVRMIPNFEAVRDRRLLSSNVGKRTKGVQVQ